MNTRPGEPELREGEWKIEERKSLRMGREAGQPV